jgi:hypothetical protein
MATPSVTTRIRSLAIVGSLGVFFASPVAAFADPSALGAPTIPAVFVGAPTNDDPNAGQFTVNFTSTGEYLGTGVAPEPPLTRDLTVSPVRPYRQARVAAPPTAREAASVNALFDGLAQQLKDSTVPRTASIQR